MRRGRAPAAPAFEARDDEQLVIEALQIAKAGNRRIVVLTAAIGSERRQVWMTQADLRRLCGMEIRVLERLHGERRPPPFL